MKTKEEAYSRFSDRAKEYIAEYEEADKLHVDICVDGIIEFLTLAAEGQFEEFLETYDEGRELAQNISQEFQDYLDTLGARSTKRNAFSSPWGVMNLYSDVAALEEADLSRLVTRDEMKRQVDECLAGEDEQIVYHSVYDTVACDWFDPKLDHVPVEGKVKFVAKADSFYGGKEAQHFESDVLDSPTWAEILPVANQAIITTNDRHHYFLEGVNVVDEDGDVKIAEFSMGS